MTKLSVVIPVFNENELIKELLRRVKINTEKITQNYEIVLVDDGSSDSTWKIIESEAKLEKRIKAIKFSRNFGHHYAITAGLHEANSDWVVVMDGDLQDRPEVIPDLFNKAQEGFDIVFVSRQNRPETLLYRLAQKVFYSILRFLSGIDFDSNQANFSIISRKVVQAFRTFPENARFYGSTIKWLGFNSSRVFADHGKRFSGRTSYTLKKRFKLAADIIIAFSARPLRFSIYLGILVSLRSFVGTIIITINVISGSLKFLSWTSLMIIIFFLAGIILIILGLIGIYLGEIFREVKKRPLYIICESINLNNE